MRDPQKPNPDMIVRDWKEFGHHFQIEKLDPPVQKGAGLRHFRLWENGSPCYGGQWHYSEDNAVQWAKYTTESSYIRRIQWLEDRVRVLEKRLYEQNHPPSGEDEVGNDK